MIQHTDIVPSTVLVLTTEFLAYKASQSAYALPSASLMNSLAQALLLAPPEMQQRQRTMLKVALAHCKDAHSCIKW